MSPTVAELNLLCFFGLDCGVFHAFRERPGGFRCSCHSVGILRDELKESYDLGMGGKLEPQAN